MYQHVSLSLGGCRVCQLQNCAAICSAACLITYCKRPVCVSEILCLCCTTTWHFCVFSGSRGDHVSSLLSSSTVLLSLSRSVPHAPCFPPIYLFLCHFILLYHISFQLLISLLCLFLSFSVFLSVYVSFSPVCPIFPPQLFFSLSSRHKSLSCWLLKCEEWQIWWFLTAVTGVPRFTSLHCPLWSWLSDLKAKYTRHE